jgi:hypothetical protein
VSRHRCGQRGQRRRKRSARWNPQLILSLIVGINGVVWRLPLRGDDIKQNGTLAAGCRPDEAATSNRWVVKTAYFRARSERGSGQLTRASSKPLVLTGGKSNHSVSAAATRWHNQQFIRSWRLYIRLFRTERKEKCRRGIRSTAGHFRVKMASNG